MTILAFVRHGQTEWNHQQRMQGRKNSMLTDVGVKQAQSLQNKLATVDFDACYVSPSLRAIQTAELIIHNTQHSLLIDDRLQEIDMGAWEGQLAKTIEQESADEWYAFWHQPDTFKALNGGENFTEVEQRIASFLAGLLSEQTDKTYLIVSHRLTIKVALNFLLKHSLSHLNQLPDIKPNSLSIFDTQTDSIISYSDISHYE